MARRRAPTPAHAQTRRGVPAAPDAFNRSSSCVGRQQHALKMPPPLSHARPPPSDCWCHRRRIAAVATDRSWRTDSPLQWVGPPLRQDPRFVSGRAAPRWRRLAPSGRGPSPRASARRAIAAHQEPRVWRRRAVRAEGAGRADPDRLRRVTGGAARPGPGGATARGARRSAAGRVEDGTGTRTA